MQKSLLLLLMLSVAGCSTVEQEQRIPVQCHEPAVQVRTNRDLAEAVLELQAAIRLCNAVNAMNATNGEYNAR